MNDMSKDIPVVAVWIVTYNHEQYISQTIESILGQKTNFKVRRFIGEDCSKDNTRNICLSYAEKYPCRIELISTKQNNIRTNVNNVWKATITSGAKYIAMCDGDDYWTDTDKLQKQVDFLDANPDFSMCFTGIDIVDEIGMERPDCFAPLDKDELTLEDIVMTENAYIPTSTLVFRNTLQYPMPSFYTNTNIGDCALFLYLTDKGKAKFLNEKTAIYRQHSGGLSKTEDYARNEYQIVYKLYEEANKYFDYRYNEVFSKRLLEISKTILIYGSRNKNGVEKIKHAIKNFPKYFKYSKRVNVKEVLYYSSILFFPSLLKLNSK